MAEIFSFNQHQRLAEQYEIDKTTDRIKFEKGHNVILKVPYLSEPRDRDSARIHTTNLSDFRGDNRTPEGRSLTVSQNLIACRFIADNVTAVRILNIANKKRKILKTFKDTPVDLQFAIHTSLLAVVDKSNNLYVCKVGANNVDVQRYIDIESLPKDDNYIGEKPPRISWCPYVPENPSDPSDSCNLLTLSIGKRVYVINLSTIVQLHGEDVSLSFEKARQSDAIMFITVCAPVTVVCISPDSTAIAVGNEKGDVSFYVISDNEVRFAHCWSPNRLTSPIKELFFLDDMTDLKSTKQEPERFWRHCIAVDEAKHIAIFECEQWHCHSMVEFDSTSQYRIWMDPRVRYLTLLDDSGSAMYCLEIDYSSACPRFASVTQLGFHTPLLSIYPHDVQDRNLNSSYDGELEDDCVDETGEGVVASFISLGTKTLAQLNVQLEKTTMAPDDTGESAFLQSRGCEEESPADVHDIDEIHHLSNPTHDDSHIETRGSARSWNSMDKDEIEQRFNTLGNKLDQLSYQVERLESEHRSGATNENMQLLQVLQQFREEISLREDRLLANISDLMETNRNETLTAVRNALNENSVAVENSIQMNNSQATDAISQRVSESLATIVVPSLDRLCTQLFKQLNENFRLGMEQYMTQLRALHSTIAAVASATPAPPASVSADRQAIIQMIKGRQAPQALETVLNQADPNNLEFVINNLDPDEFFASSHLSQGVLLSLCHQLSLRLEADTDLKFRYFEHILERLNPDDRDISPMVPNVLRSLSQGLTELQSLSTNNAIKRQARVLNQIIKNILKIN